MSLMKRLNGTHDKDILEELATEKVLTKIRKTIEVVIQTRKSVLSLKDAKQLGQYDSLIGTLMKLKRDDIKAEKKEEFLRFYQNRASLLNREALKTIEKKMDLPWWKLW